MPMKISVVIPAYNEELLLPKLLTSLQEQTFKGGFEVIVVDNNSTDDTAKIAKTFGARVIREAKQGYANACNTGFYAAKGEIIARCDADFIVPKNWLLDIYSALTKNKKLVAIGGPTYPLESSFMENVFYYPAHLLYLYGLKLTNQGFLLTNMAVKKEAFLKTNGFNTIITFGEDREISQQLKQFGKVDVLPHLYVYTSVRRLKTMGCWKFFLGYFFKNHLDEMLKKNPTIGLNPIRKTYPAPKKVYRPWVYLTPLPATLATLLLLITGGYLFFNIPNENQEKTMLLLKDTQGKIYKMFAVETFEAMRTKQLLNLEKFIQ